MTDCTRSFTLRSDVTVESLGTPTSLSTSTDCTRKVHWRDANDDFVAEVVADLRKTKSKLDAFPERAYYAARNKVFPLAVTGSQGTNNFVNRAGHKLLEVMEECQMWGPFLAAGKRARDDECNSGNASGPTSSKPNKKDPVVFADVCGGPGSFSQAIIHTCPREHRKRLLGFGMTLKDKHNGAPEGWYPDLLKSPQYFVTFGVDGTGDIYKPENVNAFASIVYGRPLRLLVADGGFEVPFEVANFQEALSLRIAYAQWFCAVRCLQEGGSFVLKLFDSFTPFMRSMMFLTTVFFETTRVVKPLHSRVVNSERYLVGIGRKQVPVEWLEYLTAVHAEGFTDDSSIHSLVPMSIIEADRGFALTMERMATVIANNQIEALNKVLQCDLLHKGDAPAAVLHSASKDEASVDVEEGPPPADSTAVPLLNTDGCVTDAAE